jgi:two-component system, chemotaxis family, CheB/CheR fusion protein
VLLSGVTMKVRMPKTSEALSGQRPKPADMDSRHLAARGPPSGPADFLIVAIGASAGGLDACRKLIDAMPDNTGMAFILVQHLDPNHHSLLVELLASHTRMAVSQAVDAVMLAPDHLYVIPPGAYLSVSGGILRLSEPEARHGARLPFDFLLHSLAEEYAARTACVVLSGTGADGTEGLKALKAKGGFVIAQEPEEAEYDGMPRSAILTGAVDLTLRLAAIPAALAKHGNHGRAQAAPKAQPPHSKARDGLAAIIDLLRTQTSHDFTLYKQGTLSRRIERRMGMSAGSAHDLEGYLAALKADPAELELLAKDLLINVTNFFRDPKVFDYLAKTTVPELVRSHVADQPLRVWIAGCSTGEEAYSLAMLLLEEITASNSNVKLQIFASDVDADAVALARDGLYPLTIAAEVSPDRLARFFSKEEHGYKVSPELRANVVFTVQDVLSDPPFSRIDLISCRNLLIYLGPEAQAKVISLFHFALRQGGLLLLGTAETVGGMERQFGIISKPERVYRHVGLAKPGEVGFPLGKSEGRATARSGITVTAPSRQTALAELARLMALKIYAPALVLINRKMECLYFLGPTDRFLHHAEGHPTNDLLRMVPQEARVKLRAAIQQVNPQNARVSIDSVPANTSGNGRACTIEVHSLTHEGEELLLVGFLEADQKNQLAFHTPAAKTRRGVELSAGDDARVRDLERELDTARTELHAAIHSLELSSEEQKAVNEEALSLNEEFQSTNEELLTSKEELQSLNEELTALNSQLQETLDRQRTTSNDLQNVLYSTDVATLFLDRDLNIRFFTPATKSVFNVIAGDVGRPLADLHSLATDTHLAADARAVLKDLRAIDREIETDADIWFIRRIMPYRNHDTSVEGVVITFTDISERKRIRKLAEEAKLDAQQAKLEAEQANSAKSRFLAAASHDLRQPLQTIAFVQGLLAKTVEGEKAQNLVKRLDSTLQAMSGMLNALLDINQIEAGVVRADIVSYPLNDLFDRLPEEFSYHAQAKALMLKVVPTGQIIHTDPHLLEQMLRNLLTNAIKYTRSGKVLLGCRRKAGFISIEIWDTGIGIPDAELQTIFEEYHQLDNAARERNRGLGLGLAIVKRLSGLLGYKVHVRSRLGKGSVFAIEIMLPADASAVPISATPVLADNAPPPATAATNRTILVVEDDPDVRELLALLLDVEGHRVTTAFDGPGAVELVEKGTLKPDLIIADYNLPKGMDGLHVVARLRSISKRLLPAIILTGDISTTTMTEIARSDCVHLNKPVKLKKLMSVIETLLSVPPAKVSPAAAEPFQANRNPGSDIIYVVDDDQNICDTIRALLEGHGYAAATFATCEAFLAEYHADGGGCLLIDAYLPGMNGFALLQQLSDAGDQLPAIMITGNSDVPMAVQAMKAGAVDFIEKPVSPDNLLASLKRALEQSRDVSKAAHWRAEAQNHMAGLTSRQKQIMELVLAGHPSKNIATDLGISQRTVENHRNAIMTRTGCKSIPALARLALAAVPEEERVRTPSA